MTIEAALAWAHKVKGANGEYVLPQEATQADIGHALRTLALGLARYRKLAETFVDEIVKLKENPEG